MGNIFNSRDAGFYIDGIRRGDVAVLSRAITIVESSSETHRELASRIIEGVMPFSGNSFRVGITGVPGVGKSSFIERFGMEVLQHNHKLAVLAIDPSSSKNKGSILGDKTRMDRLSIEKNVFIRPSPAGGTLGGVAKSSYETMLLCEAAGYDYIIVETVGVGQSETDVHRMTDFFLLLMLAGAGDELQGIKRGIMEMADALLITKADGDNLLKAKAARTEYAQAVHLFRSPDSGWTPRVEICSSLTGSGMAEAYAMLDAYRIFTKSNGYFSQKRQEQLYETLKTTLDHEILKRIYTAKKLDNELRDLIRKNVANPFVELRKILDRITF